MKPPEDCQSLDDIRVAIDTIDADIVAALGRRMGYVKAAARFKPTEESIPAPDRVAAMLPDRRRWAEEAGLDADVVEGVFNTFIHWFIDQQIRHWRAQRGPGGPAATPEEPPVASPWSRDALRVWIARALDIAPDEINDEESLIEQGLNSLSIMRLPATVAAQGVTLTFTDLMRNPTLSAWHALIAGTAPASEAAVQADADASFPLTAPFPLTEVQRAYWLGGTPCLNWAAWRRTATWRSRPTTWIPTGWSTPSTARSSATPCCGPPSARMGCNGSPCRFPPTASPASTSALRIRRNGRPRWRRCAKRCAKPFCPPTAGRCSTSA